jgi:hypothetical protein
MALALLPPATDPEGAVIWTPNKVTFLRVIVGFTAVSLFGHGAWLNLLAVALTVATIALDALDGHLARSKKMATPVGRPQVVNPGRDLATLANRCDWPIWHWHHRKTMISPGFSRVETKIQRTESHA